ncbi:MAG: hypothetical protein MJB14_00425, partial [Spirochaetes bacterium]|nr:hypothetical protein [Spirochaetota bacterium]
QFGGSMFEIVTKEKKRCTVKKITQNAKGVIFEYENEMVFLEHEKIEYINGNFQSTNSKTYLKKS